MAQRATPDCNSSTHPQVGAVEVMVEVLGECPEGAAGCLAQVAQGNEGLQAILSSPAKVVAAVAEVVLRRDVAPKALESASVMMERVMQLDEVSLVNARHGARACLHPGDHC